MANKKKRAKKASVPVSQPTPATQQVAVKSGIEERLAKLKEALDRVADQPPFTVPISKLGEPGVKTVTVVAREVAAMKHGIVSRYRMETGRMAAQVGHAVSKLKLGYVLWNTQSEPSKSYDFTYRLYRASITNVALEARDEKELEHILQLCREQGIHAVKFFDTNPEIYGHGETLTAIAIGPVYSDWVKGITDYLPLLA